MRWIMSPEAARKPSVAMKMTAIKGDGSSFDTWTSGIIIVAYAIPSFLFAILLLVLFAGGSYWQIFPLRGLTSDNWENLSAIGKILAGFPAAFVSVFFGSSLLIEVIFSLDGLGRLGFEAAVKRDYPVMFGTLYVFGMMGLLMAIISDLMYVWIDPRIDFESRDT